VGHALWDAAVARISNVLDVTGVTQEVVLYDAAGYIGQEVQEAMMNIERRLYPIWVGLSPVPGAQAGAHLERTAAAAFTAMLGQQIAAARGIVAAAAALQPRVRR